MYNIYKTLVGASLALLCLAACDSGSTPTSNTEPKEVSTAPITFERAQEIYARKCLSCHGPTGKGNGPRAKMLGEVTNLSDPGWQKARDDKRVKRTILLGRGRMPAFRNQISEAEIDGLVKVVRSFNTQPPE